MNSYFAPRRAHSADPLALDMQSLFLSGQVYPFGARLTVTHVFRSSEPAPVEVVYCFPLPRDASLTGFQISGEDFAVTSRLEPTAAACQHYAQALRQGSLAALTGQNRDGLVNLAVGNIRPGETVTVRLDLVAGAALEDAGFRLRFPFTVAPCYHAEMRVSLQAPGVGLLELPGRAAGSVSLPLFHEDPSRLHRVGFDLQIMPADGIREIASPSHALRILLGEGGGAVGVKLSPERDFPNRDLVLDVKHEFGKGRAWSDRSTGDRKHFAVVAPATLFGQRQQKTSRRIVFLLDRSGSMSGAAIEQARRAIGGCLAKLSAEDRFGLVAFDNQAEVFRPALLPAGRGNLDAALEFLNAVEARGGTELAQGIEAAAGLLAGSAGEIFLLTDGQVSETDEIFARARRCEIRLFCLGIGSASQDRFLALLARQTGGVCRFVTPDEQIETAAGQLFGALGGAVADRITIRGAQVEPRSSGPVFAGTPFFAFGAIDAAVGVLTIESPGFSCAIPLEDLGEPAQGLIEKLQGARLLAELEASAGSGKAANRRRAVLALSQRYQLASSEMSLVAVVERAGDKAGDSPVTKIIPAGMPEGMNFGVYFGKQRVPGQMCRTGPLFSSPRCRPAEGAPLFRLEGPEWEQFSRTLGQSALLVELREALEFIDDFAPVLDFVAPNDLLDDWIERLVYRREQLRLSEKDQLDAIDSLIQLLSLPVARLDGRNPWSAERRAAIRQQLEAAWPELKEEAQPVEL